MITAIKVPIDQFQRCNIIKHWSECFVRCSMFSDSDLSLVHSIQKREREKAEGLKQTTTESRQEYFHFILENCSAKKAP